MDSHPGPEVPCVNEGEIYLSLLSRRYVSGCVHRTPGPGSLRMSFQALPMPQQVTIQGLLSNEVFTVSAIDDLSTLFFPLLFKEAFINGHGKIVKTLVTTWS